MYARPMEWSLCMAPKPTEPPPTTKPIERSSSCCSLRPIDCVAPQASTSGMLLELMGRAFRGSFAAHRLADPKDDVCTGARRQGSVLSKSYFASTTLMGLRMLLR